MSKIEDILNTQLDSLEKKVCMIGLGYIGLPTASLLANSGYKVHGVDIIQSTVDTINDGKIHIVEPNLDKFVKKAVENKSLIASTKPDFADIFMIAVPTPFKDNFVPNIDYVIEATKSIAPYLKEGNLVILESTSPVGTTDTMRDVLEQEGVDISKIYIAYCPERVLPGKIIEELVSNDRVVGGINEESAKKASEFYKSFIKGEVLITDAKTAEMVKLTENSFRDLNIAFANELSILCDKFNINVWELIKLANRHPRVDILQPGVGVGGHCIAVDPWFIVHKGGDDAKIIKTAREVNSYKTQWVIEKIKSKALEFETKSGKKPKIACMGVAFKPNIDDLRESPALYVAQQLSREMDNILCIEPNINSGKLKFENAELNVIGKEYSQLSTLNSQLKEFDIIVFLVAHKEFKDLELNGKDILDFCGVL